MREGNLEATEFSSFVVQMEKQAQTRAQSLGQPRKGLAGH